MSNNKYAPSPFGQVAGGAASSFMQGMQMALKANPNLLKELQAKWGAIGTQAPAPVTDAVITPVVPPVAGV